MSNKMILAGAGVVALLVFALLAFFFVLPGGGGLANDYHYLPNQCVVVGSAKLSQIVKSNAYKDLMAEVNKLTPGKGDPKPELEKGLGLVAEDVERLTFGYAANKDTSIVATTTKAVTAADLMSKMKDRKFSEVKVGSYTMHQEQPDYLKKAFCVIDKYTVVYGEPVLLKAILERGKTPEFSADMQAALGLVDLSRSLFLAVNVKGVMASEDVKGRLQMLGPEATQVTSHMDKFETTAFDAAIGDDVQINSVTVCKDDKFADDLRKITDGAVALLKYIPQIPKELIPTIESVKTTVSGKKVTSTAAFKPAAVVAGISTAVMNAQKSATTQLPTP